ncbi:hypothetical protein [Leptotrichia sp. oral taxon 223]|jgi:hypothetical protein|uniref:hypothetical protein n=1 Tax=Leptotrichia sp. oral taxon 223 TaxID=712363 RepID=UPI0015BD40F4|nr:hypothetical protein [Leptotrichia sp. oral taxon 223]NWO18235.1 hypothetical protein [Leptotrichia sp. oral taxon 223]
MGIGRFLRRTNSIVRIIDTTKNIIEEGSIKNGLKRTVREDLEDTPIVSNIYNMGKYEGKKQGYVDASKEYEEKLLSQAEHFINQKELLINEVSNYEKLLDEYEVEIERLEGKLNKTESENQYLSKLLNNERKLKQMIR